jgi:hypothetical protein
MPPITHSAPCALYTRCTRSHARNMMPMHSPRCNVNGGSRGDELWQLRTAAGKQPYAVGAACQSKSQIQLHSNKSRRRWQSTKPKSGRRHVGVQLRAAATLRQAPLLPPAASSCSAPPAWQPLYCEEPRSQLRRHGGAGGHCDGRRGLPRPRLKIPSTTVGAHSPSAASTDHGEGRTCLLCKSVPPITIYNSKIRLYPLSIPYRPLSCKSAGSGHVLL